MTVYIIRPKASSIASSLDLTSIKFTPESRQKQWQKAIALQKEDPTQQKISEWAKDVQKCETIQFLTKPGEPGITGSTIVNMSSEQAEQIRQDFPDFNVLSDRPVDLIRPEIVPQSFKGEEDLQVTDLWHLEGIGLKTLRRQGDYASGKGVVIAVLDTGIDSSHPALCGRIANAFEFDRLQLKIKTITRSLDTDGHGTHVAGLICGKKTGVAPEAKLFSGLMIPNGRCALVELVLWLDWVGTQTSVQILNVSAGCLGGYDEMQNSITNLLAVGILPVCAIGNEGENITISPGNCIKALSVGATDQNQRVASFSSGGWMECNNHRYKVPNLVAPGVAVYSSVVQGGYEAKSGTSMAAPIVSGVASLILEKYPNIEARDLKDELLCRCKDLGQPAIRQGKGIIQVEKIV